MYDRLIQLSNTNSFFVFGARGTGKSTLLKQHFSTNQSLWIDLLQPELENQLSLEPSRLRQLWSVEKQPWVILDEVQKVPQILDVVHGMIENDGVKFALSGSSARKLKRGQANLLAGRSFSFHLYPLCQKEIGITFDLERALRFGTLPKVLSYDNPRDCKLFLKSYAHTYLKEEIQLEQLVRNMDPFRKFLPVAAMSHMRSLNYSKIARDAGVDAKSVERYFSILEETLVGFFLDSYHRSVRARQRSAPKFYFFDIGVQRSLAEMLDVEPTPRSSYYGEVFEAFLMSEIHRRVSYSEKQISLSYLQTSDGLEIDLLIEVSGKVTFLIEIKSSKNLTSDDFQALKNTKSDFPGARRLVLCQEEEARVTADGVEVYPWQEGIEVIMDLKFTE